ncbi:MAG: hypothetical protein AAF226_10965, partial [Verrucomicrobiota bacterium]
GGIFTLFSLGNLAKASTLKFQFISAGVAEDIAQTFLDKWATFFTVSVIEGATFGLMLLLAGLLTLKRKKFGSKLFMTWAMLTLIGSVFSGYFNIIMIKEQMELMFAKMDDPRASQNGEWAAIIGEIASIIKANCAFPIVVMIWFMRAKIRTQIKELFS